MSQINSWPQQLHNQSNSHSRQTISDAMLAPFTSIEGDSGGGGGDAVMPTSQIEMTLSCRNLLNRDVLSKSDPYCVVLMRDSWQEQFFEVIINCLFR